MMFVCVCIETCNTNTLIQTNACNIFFIMVCKICYEGCARGFRKAIVWNVTEIDYFISYVVNVVA